MSSKFSLPQPHRMVISSSSDVFSAPPKPPIKETPHYIPPYGERNNTHGSWKPRRPEEFGDGGSFPEIHIAQYPLNMGKTNTKGNVVSSSGYQGDQMLKQTLDPETGKLVYGKEVLGHTDKAIVVHSKPLSQLEKMRMTPIELEKPPEEEIEETTKRTKEALDLLLQGTIATTAANTNIVTAAKEQARKAKNSEPTYIHYTSSESATTMGQKGPTKRIIRMVDAPIDPLEPPKFRNKLVPHGPPDAPVPIVHSPPRKTTAEEQLDWRIPPCISNWKNQRGYTISLDKRVGADGRNLQEVQINDNFAKFSESLYIAERTAREEVNTNINIQKKLYMKQKEEKEEMLRNLAMEARTEKTQAYHNNHKDNESDGEEEVQTQTVDADRDDDDEASESIESTEKGEYLERERIRDERRRERERQYRLKGHQKKIGRDDERDISEKIALGQTSKATTSDTLYDQRLFNQTQGMDSGFGSEDSYNVYTKPLFGGSSANLLYKPKAAEEDIYGSEEYYQKLKETDRFRPDKDFSGVDRSVPTEKRTQPVEFEQSAPSKADPFGLNEFLSTAKQATKKVNPLDKIGTSNTLHAASSSFGSSTSYDGGSSRKNIPFAPSKEQQSSSPEEKKTYGLLTKASEKSSRSGSNGSSNSNSSSHKRHHSTGHSHRHHYDHDHDGHRKNSRDSHHRKRHKH